MSEKKCDTCGLPSLYRGLCPVFRADMRGQDGCPNYTKDIVFCDVCGNPVVGSAVLVQEDEKWYEICVKCAEADCSVCVAAQDCRFNNDDTCHEPRFITVQKQKGNMLVRTQEANPKRVAATCAAGCPCYSEDFGCLKGAEGAGCRNHKMKWRNKE